MGLPSGTKWAKFDIDVTQQDKFCASEFQYEKSFFSWANVQGHNPDGTSFIGIYNWGTHNAHAPWYEGQPYGETTGSQLQEDIPVDAEYDAAVEILGGSWHIPSVEQYIELINNIDYLNADGTVMDAGTTDKRIRLNGVRGIWIQSKINGNRLFFSCSGYGHLTGLYDQSTLGSFWTSSFFNERYSKRFRFNNAEINPNVDGDRYIGFPIRPVQS